MPFVNIGLATMGMDRTSRIKVLKPHLIAFLKHMTLKKLHNFIRAEINRMMKREIIKSYPYILKIESTNICNLNCGYCYDSRRPSMSGERKYGRMSIENFKKIVDEVGSYLFKINLYGFGEPLLFPETLRMVEYATQKNIGVGISSNMNIDKPNLAGDIINSGLEVLIFSCHGISQETYNKFMNKGNFELALNNIKALIKERRNKGSRTPLIDWQFCVTKFNQDEIKQALDIKREFGIDQIRFIRPDIPEDADAEWFSDLFPKRSLALNNFIGCSWPYRSAYINYDGGLLPCCRDTRRLSNDFGNVIEESFSTIWNNEKYKSSRRLIANPKEKIGCEIMCTKCPALGFEDQTSL